MKNKTIKKIIFIIIIAMILIIAIMPKTLAGITPSQINGQITGAEDFDVTFIDKLINALRFIGIFLAIGVLMIIGIKYITGSLEEKAAYKKTMIPYLIGCFLLFRSINNSTTNLRYI